MSIKLEVVDQVGVTGAGRGTSESVLLVFDRPGRAEVVVQDGKLVLHVYEGAEIDSEQPPTLSYDSDHSDLGVGETIAA